MPKDGQMDNKQARAKKAGGNATMAQSAPDGESRNAKNQSGNRHKPGSDQ